MPDRADTPGAPVREVLAAGRQKLELSDIDTAALDARVLLGHVLKQPPNWLHAHPEAPVDSAMAAQFEAYIARRCQREPVAHLVGTREFWKYAFDVGPEVLVPRPDSETLITAVLEHIVERNRPFRILDLGTGSGCLLLSLLGEFPQATGVGVDISGEALKVAARNARKLELDDRVEWIRGGWDVSPGGGFDLIVANPPYIETGALSGLEPDVVAYEPELALDGGPDGLDCYRAILGCLDGVLADDGLLVFEIGQGQAERLSVLADDAGYRRRGIHDDLSGTARVLVFDRASSS